jgi:hypothetical protein
VRLIAALGLQTPYPSIPCGMSELTGCLRREYASITGHNAVRPSADSGIQNIVAQYPARDWESSGRLEEGSRRPYGM